MRAPFGLRFVVSIVTGAVFVIWSASSLYTLSRFPARDTVVWSYRSAPVTAQQFYWAVFGFGLFFLAAAFVFRERE